MPLQQFHQPLLSRANIQAALLPLLTNTIIHNQKEPPVNAQPSLSEDSMTSTPPYPVISLALMQREHQGLDQAAQRLRLAAMPIEQLYSLRHEWQTLLGFLAYVPQLLAAMDRLIEQH